MMTEDFIIGVLLWIDDVVSCVVRKDNQIKMLAIIDKFAKKHKLKWGQEKCKIMRIGNKPDQSEWKLGDLNISTYDTYTYLGDVITPDGKNTKNIKARQNKVTVSSISINTIAASEILYRIETPVLLDLHEKVNIPGLLSNSEAWTLLKGEENEIEKAELQCLKNLFDLPLKTHTPAVIFSLGTLYTRWRDTDQKISTHGII